MPNDTPTRTPDDEIDVRAVVDANHDSDTPGTEPWRIVTKDANGAETVHHQGHDLNLLQRLGFHREADRLHREAAANTDATDPEAAARDAQDRAEFEEFRRQRQTALGNTAPAQQPVAREQQQQQVPPSPPPSHDPNAPVTQQTFQLDQQRQDANVQPLADRGGLTEGPTFQG